MKKILLILLAGAFISASMASCNKKKCGTCSTGSISACDDAANYSGMQAECESSGGTWNTD